MKKIIVFLIILIGGYAIYNEAALLSFPAKNKANFSESKLEHTSDKCDVYSIPEKKWQAYISHMLILLEILIR